MANSSQEVKLGGPVLFKGMRPFDRASALRDSVAGIELAAMNIPQALGYTSIAGLPRSPAFTLSCCRCWRSRHSVRRDIW
jgi:hypothetical protein